MLVEFYMGSGWLAKAIAYATRRQRPADAPTGASHVAFRDVKVLGQSCIYHSTMGGTRTDVRENWLSRHGAKVIEVWEVPDVMDGVEHTARELGTAYDFWNLVGNAWVQFTAWLSRGRWIARNPLGKAEANVCSELVAEAFLESGADTPGFESGRMDPEIVTPEDLRRIFRAYPSHYKRIR
jgi:hypothetical protein